MAAVLTPAGYLYKTVAVSAAGMDLPDNVTAIHSVSGCISKDFADYTSHWLHNGYWLFDHPQPMHEIAAEDEIDLSEMALFYYEIYEQEFDDTTRTWMAFVPDGLPVRVAEPETKTLSGFDVVSFSQRNAPECSPLSCNGLAGVIAVNDFCLFATFEEAKAALESGLFTNAEPGPYRILAVYLAG